MKLKNQVTNKELSEKFRKLGVKQDSVWYWVRYIHFSTNGTDPEWQVVNCDIVSNYFDLEHFSAFTVAELLERINNKGDILTYAFTFCKDENGDIDLFDFIDLLKNTNLIAKMFIWLIENKKIEIIT